MKLRVISILAGCFIALAAPGTQTIYPPLNAVSIVGTWEALLPYDPATLWHIEMRANGDSYMAQITVGTECVIRRLVASDVKDGGYLAFPRRITCFSVRARGHATWEKRRESQANRLRSKSLNSGLGLTKRSSQPLAVVLRKLRVER